MGEVEGRVGKLKEVFEGAGDKVNDGPSAGNKPPPLGGDPKLHFEVNTLGKDQNQGKLCAGLEQAKGGQSYAQALKGQTSGSAEA